MVRLIAITAGIAALSVSAGLVLSYGHGMMSGQSRLSTLQTLPAAPSEPAGIATQALVEPAALPQPTARMTAAPASSPARSSAPEATGVTPRATLPEQPAAEPQPLTKPRAPLYRQAALSGQQESTRPQRLRPVIDLDAQAAPLLASPGSADPAPSWSTSPRPKARPSGIVVAEADPLLPVAPQRVELASDHSPALVSLPPQLARRPAETPSPSFFIGVFR
ncbi:hypothetical protein MHM88_21975 [Epibacterium sp. MM17-32]|uniref:hypothetical protein n=1 Tax=Epibacterium sp. MM17-32 TaxID=2917734 RepID=UPI001EF52993|nr:hypothetical protein [Epibacterium sp. MM17-32]MCG7630480.1 hypothetical protein [Epibacterium sp. MM17-32]